MKIFNIPHSFRDRHFHINALTGTLLACDAKIATPQIPARVIRALAVCDVPFDCVWHPPDVTVSTIRTDKTGYASSVGRHLKILSWLRIINFRAALLYSCIPSPQFETTFEAFHAIDREINRFRRYKDGFCLPRSLAAAALSSSFKSNGVLLIGASLPCGDMHSWIIEGTSQPDPWDRSWINYRPLLAMVH
jgi:hypothetical protein